MIKPEKLELPNGMTVLLIESHQSPVVAFNACFRVGSVVETPDEAGICHYIEHMIFKGTPTRPAGQIAGLIEASGGEINAYTSFDETVYYCTISSRYFDEGLSILSDAVMNPLFDEEEMAREKPVILEEINRSQDSPGKVLTEALFKIVFQTHPYGQPIIGSKETVNSFTQEKVLNFYRRWYVPRNLVFVVSGDFDSKKAAEKIRETFKDFQDRPAPALQISKEAFQTQARSVFVSKEVEGHYVQIGFPIPSLDHPDLPALDILSHLMGEGLSSRLEQRIKEKKGLVDSIYTYAYTPKHPGLFVIGFTAPEKNVVKATREILKEILGLDQDRISHSELSRARVNIKSDAWYEKETVEGLARKYGYFETSVGDYQFDRKYYQKIDEVDPDAIHEVVKKYFRKEALNFAMLSPRQSKLSTADLHPEKILAGLSLLEPKKISKKEFQLYRLKNGITLLVKETLHLPLVSIRLVNFGGLRFETPSKNGVHHLFAQTLAKGTKTRSSEQIAEEIEQIAGSLDAFSGKNVDGLQGDFLSEKLEAGLDLFCDVLLNATFDPQEVEKERKNILETLKREDDQLATVAYKKFLASLYPRHPYGMPFQGSKETVKKISRADLLKIHHQLLNPGQMVISVVGDCDPGSLKLFFEEKLKHLKPQSLPKLNISDLHAPAQTIKTSLKKSKMQSHIVLGFLGTQIRNQDRYTLEVLNNVLAGQGGRLFLELRDKQSLAYSVTSINQEGIERGFLSVYMGTEPQKANQAIQGILEELRKIRTEKISAVELERAKKYLIGSYEIDLQRNANVATQMAFNQLYGLGVEEIKNFPDKVLKITAEDVLHIAQKYIHLDAYVLSVVGA